MRHAIRNVVWREMRVLLVDEETDILEQVKLFLEKEEEELDINTVTPAEEALGI